MILRPTTDVNIRSAPNAGARWLVVAKKGSQATVTGDKVNGWWPLNFNGTNGFSNATYWEIASEPKAIVVNGHELTINETANVKHIAKVIVPKLLGTRDERLNIAAAVTWWSLKEGVLGFNQHWTSQQSPSVWGFSSYGANIRIGPRAVRAPGSAWQVGIAAVQVPNYTMGQVEGMAQRVYPELSLNQVLSNAASLAGFPVGSEVNIAVMNALGELRKSWLLRDGAVGFMMQGPTVHFECILNSKSHCYTATWSPSSKYAPDRAHAMGAISDLRKYFDGVTV